MEEIKSTYPWDLRCGICALTYFSTIGICYTFFELMSIRPILQVKLQDKGTSLLEFQYYYDCLVTFQSVSNMIGCFCLGIISDKYGYQKILLILAAQVTLGQLIQFIGYATTNLIILAAGRMFSTVAFMTLQLPLGRILKKYFGPDDRFPFFNSILLVCWIIGGLLNSIVAPNIVKVYGIKQGELIPFQVAIISSLLLVILFFVDSSHEPIAPEPDLHFNKGLGYYASQLFPHKFLIASLMVQKGILLLLLSMLPYFIQTYWGARSVDFQNIYTDENILGLFWIVSGVCLLPSGIVVNLLMKYCFLALLVSSVVQWIGMIMILFIGPEIFIPVLGVGNALRMAAFNPILIDRFPKDFGSAYGVVVAFSELVGLFLTFVSLILEYMFGTQILVVVALAALQLLSIGTLMRYVSQPQDKVSQRLI